MEGVWLRMIYAIFLLLMDTETPGGMSLYLILVSPNLTLVNMRKF